MSAKGVWLLIMALGVLIAGSIGRHKVFAQPPVSTDFLISHVRLFDGERVHEDTQVAVERGIVRAVGQDLTMWRHLRPVDGTGATLIPGLIDAHVHMRDIDGLQEALRFGVTTVLDMAASGVTTQVLATLRNTAASRMDVADIRSAGFAATAPGGHGTLSRASDVPTVATVEVADGFVSARHDEGSDYLKIMINGVRTADGGTPNLDESRVKALVNAAHSRGLLAVAHVETLGDVEIALSSGIDGLAHVWRRGGANSDLARRVQAQKVFVIATLAIPDGLLPDGRAGLLGDSRLQPYLSSRITEQLSRSFTPPTQPGTDRRALLEGNVAAVRSLHTHGVRLLVGTDASANSPAVHGVSVHRELELLNKAGLSPIEALTAATMHTADAFRLTDRGRIMAGRKADMTLVRGNPMSDITKTRDILRVWRAGVEFDRRLKQ